MRDGAVCLVRGDQDSARICSETVNSRIRADLSTSYVVSSPYNRRILRTPDVSLEEAVAYADDKMAEQEEGGWK